MNLLHKVLRALHHMSDAERLLWIVLIVGAALSFASSIFERWWRRWRNYRARKRYENEVRREAAARWKEAERREEATRGEAAASGEEVARREWEDHRTVHVAARYKIWDDWLKKIGYPKGGKSSRD